MPNTIESERSESLQTDFNELYRSKSTLIPPQFFHTSQGFAKKGDLKHILQTIDDRLFAGSVKAYDVYKKFDVDKDGIFSVSTCLSVLGFVSHKDITKKMEELAVIPKEDIPILLNYLDPENKGYVNFKEFHSKIRANVTNQDENGNATGLPYIMPSKQMTQKLTSELPETRKKIEELIKPHDPSHFGIATYRFPLNFS